MTFLELLQRRAQGGIKRQRVGRVAAWIYGARVEISDRAQQPAQRGRAVIAFAHAQRARLEGRQIGQALWRDQQPIAWQRILQQLVMQDGRLQRP